jgi:hypothetical protein
VREIGTVTIEVMTKEDSDILLAPIKFEDTEIKEIGIYTCAGIKTWVVRKQPKCIELPKNVLPRHADDRENIKELCIAVNQIIHYLEAQNDPKQWSEGNNDL